MASTANQRVRYFPPAPDPEALKQGFTEENDIFKHKAFGERLTRLVSRSQDPLVLALDGGWGSGKSTFAQMWAGEMEKKDGMGVIYFDAFAHDYRRDPFLALAAELVKLGKKIEKEKTSSSKQKIIEAVNNTTKLIASVARFAAPQAARLTAAYATMGLSEAGVAVCKNLTDGAEDLAEQAILKMLEEAPKEADLIQELKTHLSALSETIGNGKPIVFIIDELDRCRPTFALELLEQIKHIFSVPGVVFVLVTYLEKLAQTVTMAYGIQGEGSAGYLEKFYQLRVSLPQVSVESSEILETYVRHMWERLGLPKIVADISSGGFFPDTLPGIFAALCKSSNISLREASYALSYLALSQSSYRGGRTQDGLKAQALLAASLPLSILRVKGKKIYEVFKAGGCGIDSILSETPLVEERDSAYYVTPGYNNYNKHYDLIISVYEKKDHNPVINAIFEIHNGIKLEDILREYIHNHFDLVQFVEEPDPREEP